MERLWGNNNKKINDNLLQDWKKSIDIYTLQKWASPMAQQVKNSPPMQKTQEMWVRALSQEDALEKEMATHSSILAWKIPWTKEPGSLQSMGSQKVRHTEWLNMYASKTVISFYVFISLKPTYKFLIKDQVRKLLKIIKTRVAQIVFKFFLNLTLNVFWKDSGS